MRRLPLGYCCKPEATGAVPAQPIKLLAYRSIDHTKVDDNNVNETEHSEHSETGMSMIRFISTSIAPILLLLFPITGIYSIGFFAISMAEKMQMGNPTSVAIALGMIRVVGSSCSTAFIQKFGRRVPLIFSSASTFLSLGIVCVLLMLDRDTLPLVVYNYSMVILLVVVMFCASLGMGPVPWLLLGEWPQVRDKVSS